MARQIITLLTDDLDGGEADETVNFALDGTGYQIDLSEANAARLREFLGQFTVAAIKVGRVNIADGYVPGKSGRRGGVEDPSFLSNKQLNAEIRAWATKNGYHLNDRGRIPQHIVNAFHSGKPAKVAAHQQQLDVLLVPQVEIDDLLAPKVTINAPADGVTSKGRGTTRKAMPFRAVKKAAPAKQ